MLTVKNEHIEEWTWYGRGPRPLYAMMRSTYNLVGLDTHVSDAVSSTKSRQHSRLMGWVSIQVPTRTLTMMPGARTPNCPVTDCDKYIEWNSRRQKSRCTFTSRRSADFFRARSVHSRPGHWCLNRQRRWIWPQFSCYS